MNNSFFLDILVWIEYALWEGGVRGKLLHPEIFSPQMTWKNLIGIIESINQENYIFFIIVKISDDVFRVQRNAYFTFNFFSFSKWEKLIFFHDSLCLKYFFSIETLHQALTHPHYLHQLLGFWPNSSVSSTLYNSLREKLNDSISVTQNPLPNGPRFSQHSNITQHSIHKFIGQSNTNTHVKHK